MKTHLFLHHTAVAGFHQQFLSVNSYHKAKGFPKSKLGFYCGYMYLIEKLGETIQARLEEEMGAHTEVKGKNWNKVGIGICLSGDFTVEKPTNEQLRSLVSLCRGIVERHQIPLENILNHWDVKKTSCPGIDLAEHVRKALKTPSEASWFAFASLTPGEQLKRLQRALLRAPASAIAGIKRAIARLTGN